MVRKSVKLYYVSFEILLSLCFVSRLALLRLMDFFKKCSRVEMYKWIHREVRATRWWSQPMPAAGKASDTITSLRMSKYMLVFGDDARSAKHLSSSEISSVSGRDGNFRPPRVFSSTSRDVDDILSASDNDWMQLSHWVNWASLCAT